MSQRKRILEVIDIPVSIKKPDEKGTVSFQVREGDLVLIEGPNGSGKTYLLNLLAALRMPYSGEVVLGTRNLIFMSEKEKSAWRRKIGLIPSIPTLFSGYTVLENLRLAAQLSGKKAKEAIEFSRSAAGLCGLQDVIDKNVDDLSEGQKKRVIIARALVGQPSLILADNPLDSLDKESQEQFLYLCVKLAQLGYAIVMSTSIPLPLRIQAARRIELGGP